MTMAATLAPGLLRKLKKVLDSRTHTPEILGSLDALSAFYTFNTLRSRRNLRSTIEKRALAIDQEFLLASDAALRALDHVEREVNALSECCDRLQI
ncbi:hypothetical protein MLD38_010432 [Melastoma candidum]|uniref:Uncharacterized protein n=1 Tax=Melastoma candidum TaxID=119954 RepID=A0ACB9QZF6_9MYRT|nr:hypothetical protein MLD38_010432 [Melastoma candidum]